MSLILFFHPKSAAYENLNQIRIMFSWRFPQLFPPLKPEVVAQKTVDAVRDDKAFLYLPWTMHALVILKR